MRIRERHLVLGEQEMDGVKNEESTELSLESVLATLFVMG